MRIFRIICFVILGALLLLLLVYALGFKIEKPAIIAVGPKASNRAYPALHLGQILRWERSSNDAFTIGWLGGEGPCKDLLIPSHGNATGGQTASCEVIRLPKNSVYYSYGVGEGTIHSFAQSGIGHCWGCDYPSENSAAAFIEKVGTDAAEDSRSPIYVSCVSSGQTGSVKIDPTLDQLPKDLLMSWNRTPDINITTPIKFLDSTNSPAKVKCSANNLLLCDFKDAANYPISYTLYVNGTGQTPPLCGPGNSTSGKADGRIDAPAP